MFPHECAVRPLSESGASAAEIGRAEGLRQSTSAHRIYQRCIHLVVLQNRAPVLNLTQFTRQGLTDELNY